MKKILIIFTVLMLTGCAKIHTPLIFGQATSVGIDLSTNPETQSAQLILGYKDANIALVPVVAGDNETVSIISKDGNSLDAVSVFGQFGVGAQGVGKFFATGAAARRLAAGYEEKLKK